MGWGKLDISIFADSWRSTRYTFHGTTLFVPIRTPLAFRLVYRFTSKAAKTRRTDDEFTTQRTCRNGHKRRGVRERGGNWDIVNEEARRLMLWRE